MYSLEVLEDKNMQNYQTIICTVLPAKSDSDVMFCLPSYQGLRIDRSLTCVFILSAGFALAQVECTS